MFPPLGRALPILVFTVGLAALHPAVASPDFVVQPDDVAIEAGGRAIIQAQVHVSDRSPRGTVYLGAYPDASNRFDDFQINGIDIAWKSPSLLETTRVWIRICDFSGCADSRTVTISVRAAEPAGFPAPFEDSVDLGGGWIRSDWLGDVNIAFFPWVFHARHSWIFVYDGSTADSAYLFDLSSGWWFWTNASTYPSLFSFDRGSWIFYIDETSAPRRFVDLESGELFSLE